MSATVEMKQFNKMMGEYGSSFEKAPSSAHQLVQFSKEKNYGFKYKQLKTLLSVWQKSQTKTIDTVKSTKKTDEDPEEINFDSLWDEYQTQYGYSPKKAKMFWSFMKEEKTLFVKFKVAQSAFDRIKKERTVIVKEGASDNSTDLNMAQQGMNNEVPLSLKITKSTSSEELEAIKSKFCELLECFRATICDDPRSPLHFYKFVNDRTKYKVSHGDVQFVYGYALENEWFEPMKRKYKANKVKIYKEQSDEGSDDGAHSDEGLGEFELVLDAEKKEKITKKKKKKKKVVKIVHDKMSDEQFDKILKEYGAVHENKPNKAAQIQKFAKEKMGENYKWKAVRIAFMRWTEFRGGIMPKN